MHSKILISFHSIMQIYVILRYIRIKKPLSENGSVTVYFKTYLEKEQINNSTKKPRCQKILTKTLIKSELFLYSKPRDEISNEDCIVEKLIENVMNCNRSNQFLSTQIIDKRYERNCRRSPYCSLWHTRFVPGSLTQRQVYTKYPNCVFKWKLFKRQVILNKKNYF